MNKRRAFAVNIALTVILFLTLSAFSAAATELPNQFDLICESHGNSGPLIPPNQMRFDLSSGHWCLNGCIVSHSGASIVNGKIILEIKNRDLPDAMKLSEVQVIYLDTLSYWGESQTIQGDKFVTDQSIRGSCHLAPYTDVTGPLSNW